MHDVLLSIDCEFGLVPIEPADASLPVLSGLTHVRTVHQAAGTLTTAPAYGEYSVVAGLHASDCRACVHYLAEHFVPNHKFSLAIGGLGATSGHLFPVGATDAYSHHADFDVILLDDRRLGPLYHARTGSTRNNSDSFHDFSILSYLRLSADPSRSSKWSPTRSAFAMMVRLGFTAAIDTKKPASTT